MALIRINTNPSARDLRWFGLILFLVVAWLGYWASRALRAPDVFTYALIGGGLTAAVYYAIPALQRPLYVGWMYAVYPIGYVVSHVLLAVVYFGVFTPVAVILRAMGKDAMERRSDPERPSYWIDRGAPRPKEDYFRQF